MTRCEVLIAGGGPAGAACAWQLGRSGFDVRLLDQATFPRDKVCAGWITPQVVADLELDLDGYAGAHVCQPITGFRTGIIGRRRTIDTRYPRPVSYGIRRCEFDDYLLKRAGVHVEPSTPVVSIRRESDAWVVNERVRADVLVGAGGHRCPVARWLNPTPQAERGESLVVAREAEMRLSEAQWLHCAVAPGTPELYFCADLKGYGWCFRKGDWINVGLGHLDAVHLPAATDEFVAFLVAGARIPDGVAWRWKGHAYLVNAPSPRRLAGDGVLLVGDAAGLAYAESGEGIRPAVESGLLAARALGDVRGNYRASHLEPYVVGIRERFAPPVLSRVAGRLLPARLVRSMGRLVLGTPAAVRHIVLNRWFLHAADPALRAA